MTLIWLVIRLVAGGIPVISEAGSLRDVEAAIDKDLTAEPRGAGERRAGS